jgi:hypothetical protein
MSGSTDVMSIKTGDFLRGDPKTRRDTHNNAIARNTLTVDEIRQAEGYGPMPKGRQQKPMAN